MISALHSPATKESLATRIEKSACMSCVSDSSSHSRTPDPSILYEGEKGQSLQDSVFSWYFQSNSWASFNAFAFFEMCFRQAHMINDGVMPSHFFRVLVEQQVWSRILIATHSYNPESFFSCTGKAVAESYPSVYPNPFFNKYLLQTRKRPAKIYC